MQAMTFRRLAGALSPTQRREFARSYTLLSITIPPLGAAAMEKQKPKYPGDPIQPNLVPRIYAPRRKKIEERLEERRERREKKAKAAQ
jgi:hypothetical protein